jgi:hypothetical protein
MSFVIFAGCKTAAVQQRSAELAPEGVDLYQHDVQPSLAPDRCGGALSHVVSFHANPYHAEGQPGDAIDYQIGGRLFRDTFEVTQPLTIDLTSCLEAGNSLSFVVHIKEPYSQKSLTLSELDRAVQLTMENADGQIAALEGENQWLGTPSHMLGPFGGFSDIKAPMYALIGLFTSGQKPDALQGEAPEALEFWTRESIDFVTLQPAMNQLFFIGDGHTGAGERQLFVVPEGARHLHLGIMDRYDWSSNAGAYEVEVFSAFTSSKK